MHLALAFEQLDHSFGSKGWWQIGSRVCTTINISTPPQYFRLESDEWIEATNITARLAETRVGSGRMQFNVTSGGFKFTNSKVPKRGARMEDFYKFGAPANLIGAPSVAVALEVDRNGTTEVVPRF